MKTAEQILEEAPVSQVYQDKMAFVCLSCPWWAHDWRLAGCDNKGRLLCTRCQGFTKVLPLAALIQTTREERPASFEAFIQNNVANTGARAPEGDPR